MFDPSLIDSFIQMNFPSRIWELFVRIAAAALCGALIGLERGIRQKEAGIRTHSIVAMGGALLMILSKYAFGDLLTNGGFALGTTGADPTRIASQAITAIAFLGAGVIFRHGTNTKGLTTAAGVWATAAIGLCLGAGLYTLGVGAALLILLINICLHKWLVRLESMSTSTIAVTMDDLPGALDDLRLQLDDRKMPVHSIDVKKKDGLLHAVITVRVPKSSALNDLLLFFGENPHIKEFSVEI